MTTSAPISVVVPTIGRPKLLADCLASITACRPAASEIVVVDQSGADAVRSAIESFAEAGARLVVASIRDRGLAVNVGMCEAANDLVLVTDDDCTVADTWVATGWRELRSDPDMIVTGRVLPAGDASAVPSTISDTDRREYAGQLHYGALYGGNMGCRRTTFLEFGGFDEHVNSAEDNDFCYRWLRAGRRLVYEPDLLVWHHAWRAPADMKRLYVAYGRGQGLFYAKHLVAGDPRIVPFLARDVYRGVRGTVAVALRERAEWPDPRPGLLRGLGSGLATGLPRTLRMRLRASGRYRRALPAAPGADTDTSASPRG